MQLQQQSAAAATACARIGCLGQLSHLQRRVELRDHSLVPAKAGCPKSANRSWGNRSRRVNTSRAVHDRFLASVQLKIRAGRRKASKAGRNVLWQLACVASTCAAAAGPPPGPYVGPYRGPNQFIYPQKKVKEAQHCSQVIKHASSSSIVQLSMRCAASGTPCIPAGPHDQHLWELL